MPAPASTDAAARAWPCVAARARRRLRFLRLALFLAPVVAGGCSSLSSPRSELLAQSYRDIQQNYLEPMPARTQAIATLGELTALDGTLSVEVTDHELMLERRGRPVRSFAAPADTDWRGWGETAAKASAAAVAVSPEIADLSSDALDAALIRGALVVLDPYSRYIPRQALLQSPLVEGSDRDDSTSHVGPANSPARAPPAAISVSAVARRPASVRLWSGDVTVARINRFTPITGDLLQEKLDSATATRGRPGAIILDLRDDPGGDVSAAIEVARLFLKGGVVATFDSREPRRREVVLARRAGDYATVPLVVLINGASASAAEIVAAALQDNGRALVVGSSSFGKGTIQSIFTLANGGELWVTSGYSLAPSGYFLQHHGVLPDICLGLFEIERETPAGANRVQRYSSLLATPRSSLREDQWAEARRLCPPVPSSAHALAMAKQILRARAPQP